MADRLLWLGVGIALGALGTAIVMLGMLRRERRAAATLRRQLDEAGVAQVSLAELRASLSGLRHDIRGILSPSLLVADRLIGHAEPGIRRAGEVVVRTVDRTIARLGEKPLDQDLANNDQP